MFSVVPFTTVQHLVSALQLARLLQEYFAQEKKKKKEKKRKKDGTCFQFYWQFYDHTDKTKNLLNSYSEGLEPLS